MRPKSIKIRSDDLSRLIADAMSGYANSPATPDYAVRLALAVKNYNLPEVRVVNPVPKAFVDLDGVTVDFGGYRDELGLTSDEVKCQAGAYLSMKPLPGAIEAIRSLIGMGLDVWIATKPPTGVPHAYSDKAAWVIQHIPELSRKIIITHQKGLLGDVGDYLIDDRPHKANCEEFKGTLIRFTNGKTWADVLDQIRGDQLKAAA